MCFLVDLIVNLIPMGAGLGLAFGLLHLARRAGFNIPPGSGKEWSFALLIPLGFLATRSAAFALVMHVDLLRRTFFACAA